MIFGRLPVPVGRRFFAVRRERLTGLDGEDAVGLPAAEDHVRDATAIHHGFAFSERELVEMLAVSGTQVDDELPRFGLEVPRICGCGPLAAAEFENHVVEAWDQV